VSPWHQRGCQIYPAERHRSHILEPNTVVNYFCRGPRHNVRDYRRMYGRAHCQRRREDCIRGVLQVEHVFTLDRSIQVRPPYGYPRAVRCSYQLVRPLSSLLCEFPRIRPARCVEEPTHIAIWTYSRAPSRAILILHLQDTLSIGLWSILIGKAQKSPYTHPGTCRGSFRRSSAILPFVLDRLQFGLSSYLFCAVRLEYYRHP